MATMTEKEIDQLVHRIDVLAGGLSGRAGVRIGPGPGWAANVKDGELYYDLGLASLLSDEKRLGVIAHEIGHLRFTGGYRKPAGSDEAFHHLVNVFEDRRIELLMVEEFPGLEGAIDAMRETYNSNVMKTALAHAEPHNQLVTALSSVAYRRQALVTDAEVSAEVTRLTSEVDELVEARTTRALAKILVRDDGVWDTFKRLRRKHFDEKAKDEVEPQPVTAPPEPEDDPDRVTPKAPEEDAKGDVPSSFDPGDGDGDTDGEDTAGPDAEGDGEEVSAQEAQGSAGQHGPTSWDDEEEDEDEDADDDESEPGDADGDESSGGSPGDGAGTDSSIDDFLSLPEDEKDRLERQLEEAAATNEEAAELLRALRESRAQHRRQDSEVTALMRRRGSTDDDRRFALEDKEEEYEEVMRSVEGESSVLGRTFDAILADNRIDRWSPTGYESGRRIHAQKLPRVAAGERGIFRRKEHRRNKRFAVGVVCDVSGSMQMSGKMGMAVKASVLIGEALERTRGVEWALYAFGTDTICLKPYTHSLDQRYGKIGNLPDFAYTAVGNDTNTAAAVRRAGEEMIGRYPGSDWRKVLVVLTDGQPNNVGATKQWVDQLHRKHDVDVVGLGLGLSGYLVENMSMMFPSWDSVTRSADLPKAMTSVMRHRIRRA
jgi:Mg-chelatase subunit ChlD